MYFSLNSTRSSLFLCHQSTQALTDLVYRVHTSQLPLVQSTLELMAFCATATKVIHTPCMDYIWLTINVSNVCMKILDHVMPREKIG